MAELCGVKPHVLRYWEQEFTQLRPMKRRGNRRYYQHHEVLLIRRIRDLLYDQGFTISGARNQLTEAGHAAAAAQEFHAEAIEAARLDSHAYVERAIAADVGRGAAHASVPLDRLSLGQVRQELLAIRETLLA